MDLEVKLFNPRRVICEARKLCRGPIESNPITID